MSVGTTGAIIGSAALGIGGSVVGGSIAAGGARDAAAAGAAAQQASIAAQTQLSREGLQVLKDQNAIAQQGLAPFIESQKKALAGLEGFTDPNNPMYGQQRDFSTRQIQQQLAAQGLLRSRGQGDSLANLELGLSQQRLGVMQGLAGTGAAQTAAGLSQGYGQQAANLLGGTGQGIGSSLAAMGQIQAQGIQGRASAIGQGFAGVNNAIQGGFGNYLSLLQLQQLTGKNMGV